MGTISGIVPIAIWLVYSRVNSPFQLYGADISRSWVPYCSNVQRRCLVDPKIYPQWTWPFEQTSLIVARGGERGETPYATGSMKSALLLPSTDSNTDLTLDVSRDYVAF